MEYLLGFNVMLAIFNVLTLYRVWRFWKPKKAPGFTEFKYSPEVRKLLDAENARVRKFRERHPTARTRSEVDNDLSIMRANLKAIITPRDKSNVVPMRHQNSVRSMDESLDWLIEQRKSQVTEQPKNLDKD